MGSSEGPQCFPANNTTMKCVPPEKGPTFRLQRFTEPLVAPRCMKCPQVPSWKVRSPRIENRLSERGGFIKKGHFSLCLRSRKSLHGKARQKGPEVWGVGAQQPG